MNPLLFLFYYFLHGLIQLATWVYYSKITVVGKSIRTKPTIFVSNHPSTMLDPLNVAISVRQKITFLANAGMFRNPVAAWLLRKLYCIPVERAQDTGGKPVNNAASFEQVNTFLAKQRGCLYVAPEGSSYVERRLRKLKTGTARMALSAETSSGWSLGLNIQPVGLNYEDPTRFRRAFIKVFGPPIRVADYRLMNESDPTAAVRCLTEDMETGLRQVVIDCEDGQQDELLHHLETILQSEKPAQPVEAFQRAQAVLDKLRKWKAESPEQFGQFSDLVFGYANMLKSLKISDLQVRGAEFERASLVLAATAPLAVPGFMLHFFPVFLSGKISRAINADLHWTPTYKFTAGFVCYVVFIWLGTWLVGQLATAFGLGVWVKWAFLAVYFPLGLVTEWWLNEWKTHGQNRRAAFLRSNKKQEWAELAGLRKQITAQLNRLNEPSLG
ncbi:MAG: 1-acyl-sn-glycerol-3-phosphate acyltransferase [Saprospiraceae bacterium]|nr:1-acyl-sn-glycerol-3-phosphate acyltransferase [Saprospiraceae bacterium]